MKNENKIGTRIQIWWRWDESYCWILDLQDSESSGSMYFSVAYQRFHALEQSKSWWMLLWNHCENCVIELVSFLTPNVKIININIKYYMNLSFFHVSRKTCLNCYALRPNVIINYFKVTMFYLNKSYCYILSIMPTTDRDQSPLTLMHNV